MKRNGLNDLFTDLHRQMYVLFPTKPILIHTNKKLCLLILRDNLPITVCYQFDRFQFMGSVIKN